MSKQRKEDSELKSKYRGMKINGKKKDIHRYLAETILGRELAKDEVVHHKDGNSLNNSPDNLMVMTRSEHTRLHFQILNTRYVFTKEELQNNTHKAWERGAYEHLKRAVAAFDKKTGKLVKVYESITQVGVDGHERKHIGACCLGKRKSHHGLIWKYVDDCPELINMEP